MSNINRIILTGNVGQEPESKSFESGATIYKFSLACKVYDGKKKEDVTHWFNVETFSKLGEYIKKGSRLAVEGKLVTNTYENKEGVKVTRYIINADNVEILDKKEKVEEENTEEIPF